MMINTKPDASPGRESLFSSHPETRVPIAELQGSGRSPSARRMCGTSPPPKNRKIPLQSRHPQNRKQEKTFRGFLLQKENMTSYGGITHIRLKGRRCILPLSLSIQAPLFFSFDGIPESTSAVSGPRDPASRRSAILVPCNKKQEPPIGCLL